MSCVVSNRHRLAHNRMGYTVEPFHVPNGMLPHLVIRDQITPLLLAKDMDNKIREGNNHIRWRKTPNRRRRSQNGLDITVLPQNSLRQVMTHHVPVGHDPSRVPTYVLKRRQVSPRLVRPPYDVSMLQQINHASIVSWINIAPSGKPCGQSLNFILSST